MASMRSPTSSWSLSPISSVGRRSLRALTFSTATTELASFDAQQNYHTFTCSKCHNPHASRLPKLMITNCLDTNHNTWEDDTSFTGTGAPTGVWASTRHSQWSAAQTCWGRPSGSCA